MSDEDALLAAIIANPDDDTPRLVYADWLQEHGDEARAEFIRLQCEPDRSEAAWKRARELEERNREKWLVGLPRYSCQWEVGRRDWEFRGGFPEHLAVPIDEVLERWSEFECARWLRSLSLRYVDSEPLQDFANRSWNPRWVELAVEGPQSIRGARPDYTSWLRALTSCSQTAQLRSLWFSGLFNFTEEGIGLLAACPYLEQLQRLHLYGDEEDPRFEPLRTRFEDRLVVDWDHPARPRM